jgi:hypothetical protein
MVDLNYDDSPPAGDTGDRPGPKVRSRRLRLLRAGQRVARVHLLLQRWPSASSTPDLKSAGMELDQLGYDTLGHQLSRLGERSPTQVDAEDVWLVVEPFLAKGARENEADYHALATGMNLGWGEGYLELARLGQQHDGDPLALLKGVENAGEHVKALTHKDMHDKINRAVHRARGSIQAAGLKLGQPIFSGMLNTLRGELTAFMGGDD